MRSRLLGAFFAGALMFTGAGTTASAATVELTAEPTIAVQAQDGGSLSLASLFVQPGGGGGATPAATTSCARMSDWFGSCKCPAGYRAIVSWTSPTTGVSRVWTGGNRSDMTALRGVGHVYGENPQVRTGKKTFSLATGRSIVYYADGQGGGNPQLTMWATCSNVF